jgi:UDP-N-acetylmuramoylalanine--D-glutamate ligase
VSEADGERMLVHGMMQLIPARELPVAGWHNAANALAACALTRAIGAPYDAMRSALRGFTGLPHRVEKVAELDGVTFYDDSKGTNVGATVAALNGFPQPVVLIAGGDGKGQNFAPLAPAVARARAVVLIGRDRERIAQALATSDVPLVRAATLEEAVSAAFGLSHAGDAVLLSPACASYDMFRNYGHRSEVFVAAVKARVLSRGYRDFIFGREAAAAARRLRSHAAVDLHHIDGHRSGDGLLGIHRDCRCEPFHRT